MKNTLRKFTAYTVINDLIKEAKGFIRGRREVRSWLKNGQPVPPPHAVKQRIIKYFLQKSGAQVFVETGTYRGDMVRAMRSLFKRYTQLNWIKSSIAPYNTHR